MGTIVRQPGVARCVARLCMTRTSACRFLTDARWPTPRLQHVFKARDWPRVRKRISINCSVTRNASCPDRCSRASRISLRGLKRRDASSQPRSPFREQLASVKTGDLRARSFLFPTFYHFPSRSGRERLIAFPITARRSSDRLLREVSTGFAMARTRNVKFRNLNLSGEGTER